MNLSPATLEDAAAIWDLQRSAYQTEAAIYDDFTIPPLVETLDQLQDQFRWKRFLKATEGGTHCRLGPDVRKGRHMLRRTSDC